MRYKTITLGLIEAQPELHERLRQQRTLRPTMEQLASELKTSHESWRARLRETRPGSDPAQIAGEALEIAVQELEEALASASRPSEDEPLALEEAMNFIRRHTPPA